jgi:hypothetical protein
MNAKHNLSSIPYENRPEGPEERVPSANVQVLHANCATPELALRVSVTTRASVVMFGEGFRNFFRVVRRTRDFVALPY